jgi:preprotein translocase subunit SecB
MTDQEKGPQQDTKQLAIQRIYLKDVSFESPNAPDVFREEWKPQHNLGMNTGVKKLAEGAFEVILTLTLTVKVDEKTAYLIEVQQAGIFAFQGFAEPELAPLLGAYCPNVLFPYAREVISDLATKGSFPQMLLQPVNFDALFMQHQQEMAKRADATQVN